VPFGLASVVIGGVTFSWTAGNIALGAVTPGVVVTAGSNAPWGGVLISSIIGSGTTTGVASASGSSFAPGASQTFAITGPSPGISSPSEIAFFGYGFVPAAGGGVLTIATPTGAAYSTAVAYSAGNGGVGGANGAGKPDANGAFFATAVLGDTPYSAAGTPTTAASYTATVTQAAIAPANILSPTFGVKPWTTGLTASTVDYTTTTEAITAHGFSATEGLTLTIGTSGMVSGGTCTTTSGGTCSTVAGKVPDIAGGLQNTVVTGGLSGQVVTTAGAVTYVAISDFASGQTLSINSGGAGQTSVIRSQAGYGIHGLAGNTVYNIMWNAISGGINVGTFTSTSTGAIPIPGVQFTVPSDSSGIHILDIQTAGGASAFFGSTILGESTPSETPFSSTDTTAFGDMLFNNIALLQASPSVAVVGSPESLSGTGLSAGATYVVALGTGAGTVSVSAPALATFVATSAGGVPGGTSITLADTSSVLETGTLMYISVQTAAHFGVSGTSDAYAQFVLASSANLNMTSAPAGHPVTLSAHSLNAGAVHGVYSIVFNYVQSPISSTSFTGTTVGVIAPNSVGAGSATFNIPASALPGTYVVQLVVSGAGTGGAPVGTAVLDTPLQVTVGGTSGSCANEGTACMGISGTPAISHTSVGTIITASFTNNSNAPQTGYVYAVVHNALGQTVYYTTATVSPAAGASQSGQLVLFGLAPGTYSATIFVVSTSGTAISGTTLVSVTIS
jgi:hypothetical protein